MFIVASHTFVGLISIPYTHVNYIHKGLQTKSFLEVTQVKTNLYDDFAEHINEYFTGKH